MTNLDTSTAAVLMALVVLAALALIAWAMQRRKRSEHLQQRFGSEYARTVEHLGSRDKAEAELRERERRVQRLHIRPLSLDDAQRFDREWKRLQACFVDDPRRALAEADLVVRELMMVRGYPMADFERRAADISVDHPSVVDHYRAAHDITVRDSASTDTEDLRKAVVHYRALFTDLLEVNEPPRASRRSASPRLMETR
jgi:hypothetical protein